MTEKEQKLQNGDKAPDFKLTDPDGKEYSLKDFLGKPFVLYFYPKDDTPGCTKEACAFRDNLPDFSKLGVDVYGVSPDDAKSHLKFKDKYDIPFTLLSDPEKKTLKDYGAWGVKKMFGKESEGVIRSTFIIDKDGVIFKSWRSVRVNGHVEKVLEHIKKLAS